MPKNCSNGWGWGIGSTTCPCLLYTSLSIGQAIKLLNGLLDTGENPLVHQINDHTILEIPHQSIEQIQPALIKALMDLDEEKANRIMRTSFSMYPLETILLEIIAPTMVEIGDHWHRGDISVATEHFATHHCRLHLMHALEATNDIAKHGSIVAACAPQEWHDIGILMLVTILRLRSWNVTYLEMCIRDRFGRPEAFAEQGAAW